MAIEIFVHKTTLEITKGEPILEGLIRANDVVFTFDEQDDSWRDTAPVALFKSRLGTWTVQVDEKGRCKIPWEVTAEGSAGSNLSVGLYGARNDNSDIIVISTTWLQTPFRIMPGLGDDADPGLDPTPSQYQQVLTLASEFIKRAEGLGAVEKEVGRLAGEAEEAEGAAKKAAGDAQSSADRSKEEAGNAEYQTCLAKLYAVGRTDVPSTGTVEEYESPAAIPPGSFVSVHAGGEAEFYLRDCVNYDITVNGVTQIVRAKNQALEALGVRISVQEQQDGRHLRVDNVENETEVYVSFRRSAEQDDLPNTSAREEAEAAERSARLAQLWAVGPQEDPDALVNPETSAAAEAARAEAAARHVEEVDAEFSASVEQAKEDIREAVSGQESSADLSRMWAVGPQYVVAPSTDKCEETTVAAGDVLYLYTPNGDEESRYSIHDGFEYTVVVNGETETVTALGQSLAAMGVAFTITDSFFGGGDSSLEISNSNDYDVEVSFERVSGPEEIPDTSARAEADRAAEFAEEAARQANEAYKHAQSVNPDEIYRKIDAKGDNLEFDSETSLLWITSNGERIGNGIQVATSGGGGGTGGGGESNNATLTLKNTSGWIHKTIAHGAECPVSFVWSSLEDGLPTGGGVLKILVNDSAKHTSQVEQGEHPIDVGPFLSAGNNAVKLNVTDAYGNSRSLIFDITSVSLELTSSFDPDVAYTDQIQFPYTPVGALEKTVIFKVDGVQIGTATVSASGRQQTYTIPAQSHGAHNLEVYFTANIDGQDVPSNSLHYAIICTEEGNEAPIIAVDWRIDKAEQYDTLTIPYMVYDPLNLTAQVTRYSSESGSAGELDVDRTKQTWSYRIENEGELALTLTCMGASGLIAVASIAITVSKADIKVEAETEGLSLYLTSYGRSNNEADPSVWKYGTVEANLTGFNFTSDGWMEDEQGITVLRVGGDARVEIPVQLFAKDFRTTGKTIEIEFASRSVLDYDAVLATCWAGDRGLTITAQQAGLKSEKSYVVTDYKEDDHLRLSFVIEKRKERRLIISYVNGIISGMVQYPDDDDFSQGTPVSISLGSNDCTLDIYNIRVYENDLTRHQVLDNWIADTQDLGTKKDRYVRNEIFDGNSQILPSTLRPHQKYLILDCPLLPTYKGDKKTCSGRYVDPVVSKRSFTFTGAQIDVQGTSSQYYYVKNFKIKFNDGFVQNGRTTPVYAMNDKAVPTAEFTFKADVASSEGANNVVLAELYNDLCPVKTPAQEADPRVRQCIEGHPIVVFHDDGSGPKFIGKYNFNNDKGTAEVFGFAAGDESWEIKENGNAQVSFKTDDFTNWQTSFEARYPEDNTDISRLRAFVAWVASTNTEGLSEEEKATRLAKFKTELPDWADVDDAIFYYLFTLIFLCIDQREKNAFPTYNAEMAKWIWLFYDADSSIGTDNKGNLTFEYWMEDIDFTDAGDPVFNGQNNVFWSNLRECFADEIRDEYRRLRTEVAADGKVLLSYDKVNELFSNHQSQWSEAIYNEDAWRKAVEPLEKANDIQYLSMQQGKKEQHFKHWMFNRFRYLDSKFETGAALDDENRIMMRAHAQGNITLTSYINMYGQVYFNSQKAVHRMKRDQEYEFEWSAQGGEDAVIGVNSAPMITSLGDLSPLKLEYCHIQYATHLTELKVGDATAGYVNDNFVELTLGNNTLLRKLDARNCMALTQAVDASGCTNIEEIYFDGTGIVGLSLPNGGILKKLHLPGTITDLTLRNQTKLEEFVLPSYSNITTLRLENAPACVDGWSILQTIPANSRVRMIGFSWERDSAEDVLALYDYLDTMRGLDENGNNVDKPQMQGSIHVENITGSQLAEMRSRYPSIAVTYDHITSSLYFYDDTGSKLFYTADCVDGADAVYKGSTPTKTSTAQYSYSFANGWSRTPGGPVDPNALKNVTADRKVYAVFNATVRTYTATWKNGSTTLETDANLPYGTIPTYNGEAPEYKGEGDKRDYEFSGWDPSVGPITGNTTYTAKFTFKGYEYMKLLGKSIAGGYAQDTVTKVGDYAFNDCDQLTSVKMGAVLTVGDYAFQNCGALETVAMYKAASVGANAFSSCSNLKTVYLSATTIASNAFTGCSQLNALILYGDTVCTLVSGALTNTAIANGTGYVYVPAALVDSYKANSAWSAYANQIRAVEDYPAYRHPASWEAVAYHLNAGDCAEVYSVGDEIPLDLGSEGKITMQVAALDTDVLADGTGTAPMTFIAKDLLATPRVMNSVGRQADSVNGGYLEGTGAIGGWEKCEMRTYLQDTIKPMIPDNVRDMIVVVQKKQKAYTKTGSEGSQTTNEDLWLLSSAELNSTSGLYKAMFPDNNSRKKSVAGGTTMQSWWNRDAHTNASFRYIDKFGQIGSGNDVNLYAHYICLCFCVGKKEG